MIEKKQWIEILKIIRTFLNPAQQLSGYLKVELKYGWPVKFTLRVNSLDTPFWGFYKGGRI